MREDEMVGWHHDSVDMSLSKLREMVKDREAWCAAVHGVTKRWMQHGHWISNDNVLPAASHFTCASTSSLYAVFPTLC